MQSTITNSNLGPTLKSLCYPPITACCINFVKKILWTQQKKKKKRLNQITTSEQIIQQKTYSNKKFKIHNHSNL